MSNLIERLNRKHTTTLLLRWCMIIVVVSLLVGSASAIFLHTLKWSGLFREEHLWIVAFLPLAGWLIAWMYQKYGEVAVKGNNLLITESYTPQRTIPLVMAPLVYIGTILTHLFGGSAGREGTAVQMGGSIADQFSTIFKLSDEDRKVLIAVGVSAGFASVFGTPLTGTFFALEVLVLTQFNWRAIVPCLASAYGAYFVGELWMAPHTEYHVTSLVDWSGSVVLWSLGLGVVFGITAFLFSGGIRWWNKLFSVIQNAPLRTFIGGAIIATAVYFIGHSRYIGLGVPHIVDTFHSEVAPYDFAMKLLFTTFTIGLGFKGGEVTPLFYVGATLGNAIAFCIPGCPISYPLLAAMGFVAVFSGATNTPIACIIMGYELFGLEVVPFIMIPCVVAYFASGRTGIYTAQKEEGPKYYLYKKLKLME